jgi:hypothetical protein
MLWSCRDTDGGSSSQNSYRRAQFCHATNRYFGLYFFFLKISHNLSANLNWASSWQELTKAV